MAPDSAGPTKFLLGEDQIPTAWFNVVPSMPTPPSPPLHPGTMQPIGPDDLAPLFPMALIGQEVTREEWVDIPGPVLDVYKMYRPTPLYRARRLEAHLGTPARIYYKYEGVSPAGSHKPNTAIAQAYYNKAEGVRRLATETGAGQWGSALAMSCAFFGLECQVYMVGASYRQKPGRRTMMETWGARVTPSPSTETEAGKAILAGDPDSPGSLGIAISEAVEDAAKRADTKYALGSVLNHVLLHQTVIGLEARAQMDLAGDAPDLIIGCVGGGSNYSGLAFPFVPDKTRHGKDLRFLAVEPTACPTLTKGSFEYDFGDTAATTPLIEMHTLGHTFVPPPIHAGGLRYHGDAPALCRLVADGVVEAVAYPQTKVFEAAVEFARVEGIIPAPESAHAVRAAMDEARACKETGESKAILFGLSGHGLLDLQAYQDFLGGDLLDG
ncbi:MAG TPA: TrpB-like pyridoxal phosphate-dependent enzyme [Actinomycetota bacterium]|nr:TrpB-like pyridoxal phosphate-dependent enzyme [Actinomycetota bacterium]